MRSPLIVIARIDVILRGIRVGTTKLFFFCLQRFAPTRANPRQGALRFSPVGLRYLYKTMILETMESTKNTLVFLMDYVIKQLEDTNEKFIGLRKTIELMSESLYDAKVSNFVHARLLVLEPNEDLIHETIVKLFSKKVTCKLVFNQLCIMEPFTKEPGEVFLVLSNEEPPNSLFCKWSDIPELQEGQTYEVSKLMAE